MEYQVLARKWRPQKFSDVVGQEHIVRTLQNALLQERTAHAYLFVGPRGIGKTTIARIFAKALNCKNYPVSEPCCECESCKSIADNSSLDVIEIDGASKNSVQDVRELRDEVRYTPASSRYKIYIIDEVHMLSQSAWNALLKTVEEPPPHVKFLFATTEAHKVIPTIVSRCQRFDLRRISSRLIAEHLKKIANAENVRIDHSAIEAIARAADGAMRDAQSLLDQMISFYGSEKNTGISEEHVLSIFGLTSSSEMEKLVRAILEDDKTTVVSGIHNLAIQGKNLEKLYDDLLFFIRGVQISKMFSAAEQILETGEDFIQMFRRLGENISFKKIQSLLEHLAPMGRTLHDALNKQVFLETIILRAMRICHAVQIEDLIARLNQIRKNGELSSLEQIPLSKNNLPENAALAFSVATVETQKQTLATQPSEASEESYQIKEPQKIYTEPEREKNPSGSLIGAPLAGERLCPPLARLRQARQTEPGPSADKKQYTPELLWHALISDMNHMNTPFLKAYMQEGIPESFENGVLTVCYDEEFEELHVTELKKEITRLNHCLHRITGDKNLTLRIMTKQGIASPHEIHHQREEDLAGVRKKIENNKFVQTVIELFDGKIVDVRG